MIIPLLCVPYFGLKQFFTLFIFLASKTSYPFPCWWVYGQFLGLGYYKYCYYKHVLHIFQSTYECIYIWNRLWSSYQHLFIILLRNMCPTGKLIQRTSGYTFSLWHMQTQLPTFVTKLGTQHFRTLLLACSFFSVNPCGTTYFCIF